MARLFSAEDLGRGLRRGEFLAFFQPYVNPLTGAVVALEATLRWRHPRRGDLAARDFICEADQHGFLEQLVTELIDQAALASLRWRSAPQAGAGSLLDLPIVVSLSGAVLRTAVAQQHIASYGADWLGLDIGALLGADAARKIDLGDCDDSRPDLLAALGKRHGGGHAVVTGVATVLQWHVVAEQRVPLALGDFICPPTPADRIVAALAHWQSSFSALNACAEISPT